MFKLTNSEQSLKIFFFFEFSGFYKNILKIGNFLFYCLSNASFVFLQTKFSRKKEDNECCVISNPRNYYHIDCKVVTITFVQYKQLVYRTLLIQYLNACKSLIVFLILVCIIKMSIIFIFLVNQLKIAMMATFLPVQNIENFSELRLKFMGS